MTIPYFPIPMFFLQTSLTTIGYIALGLTSSSIVRNWLSEQTLLTPKILSKFSCSHSVYWSNSNSELYLSVNIANPLISTSFSLYTTFFPLWSFMSLNCLRTFDIILSIIISSDSRFFNGFLFSHSAKIGFSLRVHLTSGIANLTFEFNINRW